MNVQQEKLLEQEKSWKKNMKNRYEYNMWSFFLDPGIISFKKSSI